MEFVVEMLVNKNIKDAWGNDSKLKYTRLRYELSIKRITNSSGIQDLVVSKENSKKYFEEKGYKTLLSFSEMIL